MSMNDFYRNEYYLGYSEIKLVEYCIGIGKGCGFIFFIGLNFLKIV